MSQYIIFTAVEFFEKADPEVVEAFIQLMPPEWRTKEDFLREYDYAVGYLEFRSYPAGFWSFHINDPLSTPRPDVYVPIMGKWYQGEGDEVSSQIVDGTLEFFTKQNWL